MKLKLAVALILVLLSVVAWGQRIEIQTETNVSTGCFEKVGGTWNPSVCSAKTEIKPTITKRCAFDLKPQMIRDTRPIKPSAKDEMFPPDPPIAVLAVAIPPRVRQVCPYERAIELFGEDRVRFEYVGRCERPNGTWDESRDYSNAQIHLINNCGFEVDKGARLTHTKRVLVDGEVVYEESK